MLIAPAPGRDGAAADTAGLGHAEVGRDGAAADVAGVGRAETGSNAAGAEVGSDAPAVPDARAGDARVPEPDGPCVPPSVPATLTATPGESQVSLSWTPSPGATLYTILRKAGPKEDFVLIGSSPSASYIDGPLTNGTTYSYVVAASNGSCTSAFSHEQAVTPGLACTQAPPTNLRAEPSGSVQVALTWTPPVPAPKSQTISRSLVSGSGYQAIGSVSGDAANYKDSDPKLLKDTKYYYQVTANGSCMATSSEIFATPKCLTPRAPAAPTVSNSNGALAVAWNAVSEATAYSVFRDTSPSGLFKAAVSTAQTATSYTDPAASLSNGATYYYKVNASNAGDQCSSELSNVGSGVSCAPPAVPTGLQASAGSSGQIRLTWTASPGATQYTVLRGSTSGAEVTITPPGTPPTSNSYTDSGLTNGSTYYYKVSAQNGAKNICSSAASAEIAVSVGGTASECPVLGPNLAGYQPPSGLNSYCFVTCWDLAGTIVSGFFGRSLSINGVAVPCGTLDESGRTTCTIPSGLTRDFSVYATSGAYVFRISAGSNPYPTNSWWGASKTCQ